MAFKSRAPIGPGALDYLPRLSPNLRLAFQARLGYSDAGIA